MVRWELSEQGVIKYALIAFKNNEDQKTSRYRNPHVYVLYVFSIKIDKKKLLQIYLYYLALRNATRAR